MATLSGSGGLFDFSSLFSNLGGTSSGVTLFGSIDTTSTTTLGGGLFDFSSLFGSTGSSSSSLVFGTGSTLDFSSLFGSTSSGSLFSLDFSSFGGTSSLFGTGFGTGSTLDFSSLFGSGGTTFNFFS